ncbi:arginine deiminase domain protein [Mycobacterium kansasii 732]|nr:arginine deiminase domain protein [Mycobacterium kansasii 732]
MMYAAVVEHLSAFTIQRSPKGVAISDAAPFVRAASDAMGIDKLRVIGTGLDPVVAEREQWDDGNNTLALAPVSSSPTSATRRPTPGWRRRASRC